MNNTTDRLTLPNTLRSVIGNQPTSVTNISDDLTRVNYDCRKCLIGQEASEFRSTPRDGLACFYGEQPVWFKMRSGQLNQFGCQSAYIHGRPDGTHRVNQRELDQAVGEEKRITCGQNGR